MCTIPTSFTDFTTCILISSLTYAVTHTLSHAPSIAFAGDFGVWCKENR